VQRNGLWCFICHIQPTVFSPLVFFFVFVFFFFFKETNALSLKHSSTPMRVTGINPTEAAVLNPPPPLLKHAVHTLTKRRRYIIARYYNSFCSRIHSYLYSRSITAGLWKLIQMFANPTGSHASTSRK